ncbi:MAG: D-alanine--D-alanine ligase family protein [Bacillota bacterium]|nr:D-alanine--D-alanine ligase [Bacillota bacterium]MDD3297404.1 D-alanine--D-alanine ligase [Bacillota bacterium]MDD3851460.1 D-alanine--D-alanine ligase [Bacillota bacterium]MDD4707173.1 D-alanine--D-alanine ligase [Bacillota bacterium]
MNKKLRVAVVFGGQSGEHEVSLMSSTSIINALDKEKYEIIMIGITRQGSWKHYDGPVDKIITGEWERGSKNLDESKYNFLTTGEGFPGENIDVVFPVLHGPMGEDGTIQGLFELAGLAYVGCGVLASAVGMDKVFSKTVFERAGLKQADYSVFMKQELDEDMDGAISSIEKRFNYPVFIKPANLGSSVGITKAHGREELARGLVLAARYDRKIIVEEFIDGHEVECSVLGNDTPRASVVGQILPSNEFYDYQAKYYDDGKSGLVIPADISPKATARVKRMAVEAFKAIDGSGLARADFFVDKRTDEVYINEINTMPGFTKISMYPKLWDAAGLPYPQLLDTLIDHALERRAGKVNTALV